MRLATLLIHGGVILLTGLLITGCSTTADSVASNNEEQQSNTTIAVVDINEIARQIGATDLIQQSVSQFESKIKSELQEFKARLDQEYDVRQASISSDLNVQNQEELNALQVTHQTALSKESMLWQSQLNAHHNKLRRDLLDQIRPVAYQIANEQGMSIVLTTSQVYAAGPAADITKQVAARINTHNREIGVSPATDNTQRVADLPGGGAFQPQ